MVNLIICLIAIAAISTASFAEKIESNDSQIISSTTQCEIDENPANMQERSVYKLIENGVITLKKELPLSNSFFSSKIDTCFLVGKYTYVTQNIKIDDPYLSKRSIIYLHQLNNKGKIINSIKPFSNAWSCWSSRLLLNNSSSLRVSAICIGAKDATKETTLDQNLTMNLNEIPIVNKGLDSFHLKLNQPIVLTGTVIGPITVGNKSEGNNFTAFYLNLNKNYVVDDKDSCGPQTFNKLAIEKFGLSMFKGKKVQVEGSIYCQPERTGTYHLNKIKSISLLD